MSRHLFRSTLRVNELIDDGDTALRQAADDYLKPGVVPNKTGGSNSRIRYIRSAITSIFISIKMFTGSEQIDSIIIIIIMIPVLLFFTTTICCSPVTCILTHEQELSNTGA